MAKSESMEDVVARRKAALKKRVAEVESASDADRAGALRAARKVKKDLKRAQRALRKSRQPAKRSAD